MNNIDLYKLLVTITADNKQANNAIDDTGKHVDDLSNKSEKGQSKIRSAFQKIGSVASGVGKVVGTGLKAAGAGLVTMSTAVVGLGKQAVSQYGEYEQLIGGVNKLFGESGAQLVEYANKAYKTAGMSANEYMSTVTGFSASLINSLSGDTDAAVKIADRALRDMADNANTFGTDMTSIQNAYQGFAKQNYTMLDNLKLGYGGTKTEMERLIADAAKMTEEQEALNVAIKDGDLSFANIANAISVVQKRQNIMDTTAHEAASTIQGSIATMKASWSNLLVGMSDDTQDFDKLMQNFIQSVGTVGKNLMPRIQMILSSVVTLVSSLAPQLVAIIPGLVGDLLPEIINAAGDLMNALVEALPAIVSVLTQIIPELMNFFIEVQNSIVEVLPELIRVIVDFFVNNIDILLNGAIQFFGALVAAIPVIIDALQPEIPRIVITVCEALEHNIPLLLEAAGQLFMAIVHAIPTILQALGGALVIVFDTIVQILSPLVDWFSELWGKIKDAVANKVNAIKSVITTVFNAVKSIITNVTGAIHDTISNVWNKIHSATSSVFDAIRDRISSVFNNIKSTISSSLLSAKNTVINIFDGIKNAISDKITAARNKVHDMIESIKAKFNFTWSLPKLKLPHFSISGKFSLNPPSIPHFSVDWYQKAMDNAMLLNAPTIFGMNSSGNLLGGGEAGQEVVSGSDTLMRMIRDAVKDETTVIAVNLERLISMLAQYFPEIVAKMERDIVFDDGAVAARLLPRVDSGLGAVSRLKARGQ